MMQAAAEPYDRRLADEYSIQRSTARTWVSTADMTRLEMEALR